MKKQDPMMRSQTCVLRVENIHCDGCKGKIRKTLRKIDGVNSISIDVEQGKVTVTGNVDPAVLIRKLDKSGKHAELWSSRKGLSNNNNNRGSGIQFDLVSNPLKGKGGKDQKVGFQQKIGGNRDHHMKDERKVKFEVPVKGRGFESFDDDFSGDDSEDWEESDFGDEDEGFDEEMEEEFGYQRSQKKVVMPIKGSKNRKVAGKEKKVGGKVKKGGSFMAMIGRAIGGKGKGKDGNVGKKGARGGGGGGKNKGGGNQVHDHGRREGKIGNKGGGGGNKGGKNGMFSDFEVTTNRHNGGGGSRGGGGRGQYQAPVARGPPAQPMMNMNGGGGGGGNGYHPGGNGMGPMGPMMQSNPYQQQQQQQQQQYMAMMMNQQRMMNASVGVGGGGGDMYHAAMYGRPPPGYGYVPPMPVQPPPPGYQDPYTHMFSDENTSSCSIM